MKKSSSVLPNIRPASDLRTKFTQVMAEIYKSDRPVFLTKKGRCDTVIMTADTFAKYEMTEDARFKEFFEGGKKEDMRCSFCRKPHYEVKKLIAGSSTSICNECVALCVDILAEESEEEAKEEQCKITKK